MNTITTDIAYDPVMMGVRGTREERGMRTAEEFESLFINELMKEMDQTVERDETDVFFSESESTYRSMFHQELSREIAKGTGLGLKNMVAYQLQKEAASESMLSVRR